MPLQKPNRRDRGAALIMALMTCMLVGGIIVASTGEMSAMTRATEVEFQAEAQSRSLAEAGLVDGYAWLRRQTVQPVATFAPRRDLSANPPVNETDDPSLGLVREFEISRGLWGRYVVTPGAPPEPFTDDNGDGSWQEGEAYTDVDGNDRWSPGHGTRDVTKERGLPGVGAVWLVESTGMVFRRPRADLPLDQGPNVRLSSSRVASEIRRLTIAPPAQSAICATRGSNVTIGNRGRLRGSVTGITYATSTGTPYLQSGSEVLTPTKYASIPSFGAGVEDVFGVDLAQLKSMADLSTAAGVDGLPSQLPDFSLVVVDGDVTFGATHPLRGTGVLVVNGDLTIGDGSNSFFNGVIHVSGNLTVRAPAYLRGTIVVEGKVTVSGTGGDYAEIEHDPDIISRLLTVMGQYRLSKATYQPGRVTPDGRPYLSIGPEATDRKSGLLSILRGLLGRLL